MNICLFVCSFVDIYYFDDSLFMSYFLHEKLVLAK